MRYLVALLLTAVVFVSCKKESAESNTTNTLEEVQVSVIATPANDTTITATTNIVRVKLR